GYPLGSHIDMLHQSPFSMGIAHDSAMAYWVMDGHNDNICKYDYVMDHGPGYDNHGAGKIWRYIDVSVTRVPQVPSHMVLDKSTGWLYYVDGGPKKIKRMDTNSGTITGTLTVPATASEPLAGYWKVQTVTVEELDTLTTQPCGIDYYNGRLIVSDYTTGDIYLYSTTSAFTLLQTIVTGHPGMMGVKVGPDGHIWCVNKTESKVYRLDVTAPATDAAIISINTPSVENFIPSYYATIFNVCDGNITPEITIANNGINVITSLDLEYTIDAGSAVTFTWNGTLNSGSTATVTFPFSTALNGSHLLTARINTVNGVSDDVDLNNTFTGSFRVINPPSILPFTEGFTATTFPPAGWNYVNFNKNCKMSRVTVGGFGASTGSMKMDNYSGNMDITGQKDYLMSPIVDMTNATANTWLRFNVAYAKYNTASNDGLQVVISTDCGNTWTSVYNKSGTTLSTAPVTTGTFTPTATQWRTDSVSMAAYAGQAEVILNFTSISNYGNNFYVDDIFVGDVQTGISENAFTNSFSVYPNPASDILYFSLNGYVSKDKVKITLTDIQGKEAYSTGEVNIVPNQTNSIQLKKLGLAKGMYFLNLSQGSSKAVKKIIVE
ncbi:MAG: T9SS type A sorting domain-containing protein, partial [Bacteroidia bacterium]